MKLPWVNILLFILLALQTLTGYFGFTNGRESAAWLLWLHGIGAYAVSLLLFFKAVVILDAWRRKRRWTGRRIGFLVTLLLLIFTLLLGLLWTFGGPIYLGGFSLVSLHIYAAVPLMLLMLWHSWHMRFIRRVEGAAGRRLFLGGLLSAAGGLFLWATAGRVKSWAGWTVSTRRFTGSYEVGSFTGDYPVVSWIADRPPPIEIKQWSLRVEGAVARPYSLTYAEIEALPRQSLTATLDCTGGWFSEQRWAGVGVADLLVSAGLEPSAASVTFEAASGYKRRFGLDEAMTFLLALGTLSEEGMAEIDRFSPLAHGHGYPIRLVAPGRRGMEWVKWLSVIRVNETGPLAQSPLPMQ
jgi:DMSO/TMAO reductase YedYZ molybdopterin-dependent catalytic subunit